MAGYRAPQNTKVRVGFQAEQVLIDRVEASASASEISMSELIRKALEYYLAQP